MEERGQAIKERLRELHSGLLWKSIGLLDADENLSERDEWGVVEWESE